MKKLLRKNEGFTLIELLIVVAIIGIIAGIAIPNFLGARSKARVTRAFADMRAIADALESYYVDNTAYPAALAGLTPTHITSLPNDVFPNSDPDDPKLYRYYTNATTTAWLVVSNGPDRDDDVTPAADAFANEVSGELGGPNGIVGESHYGSDKWHDPTAGATSDGDLGRGGP